MSNDNTSKLKALEETIKKLRENYRKQDALLEELEEYIFVCRAIGHDDFSQVERMYPGGRWRSGYRYEYHRDTEVKLKGRTKPIIIRDYVLRSYRKKLRERGCHVPGRKS